MNLFQKVILCCPLSLDDKNIYGQFEEYYGTDVADSFCKLCEEDIDSIDDLYHKCIKIAGENLDATENTGWDLDDIVDLWEPNNICYDIYPDVLISAIILLRSFTPSEEYPFYKWIHNLQKKIGYDLHLSIFSKNINKLPPLLREFLGIKKDRSSCNISTHYSELVVSLIFHANSSPFSKSKEIQVSYAKNLSFLIDCINILSQSEYSLDIEQYYIFERLFSIKSRLDFFEWCLSNKNKSIDYISNNIYYLPVVSAKNSWFQTTSRLGIKNVLDRKTSRDILQMLSVYAFPLTLSLFYSYLVKKNNYSYEDIIEKIKMSSFWKQANWDMVLKSTREKYSLSKDFIEPNRNQKSLYSKLFWAFDFDIDNILIQSYTYNQMDT